MALITHIQNPFDPINSRVIVLKDGGKPLHTYYEGKDENYEVVVSVNGFITDDIEMIINQNDSVAFIVVPQGGGDSGNKMTRSLMMVVVAVASFYTGGAVGAAYGAAYGAAAGAVVTIAGGMLINAIAPLPTPDFNNPSFGDGFSNSSTYSWGNQQNSLEEGIAIPVCYGTNRIVPPIISQYVETIGDKQYLNTLYAVNDGEVTSISDIYINDNPISNYNDISFDTRLGTNNQTLITRFDNTRADVPINVLISTSYTERQTTGNDINAMIITVVAPSGLYSANDAGGLDSRLVEFIVEYKKVGDVTWTEFTVEEWRNSPFWYFVPTTSDNPYIKGNQNSPIRVTFGIEGLDAAQYDVRIKRLVAESTSPRVSDKVVLEAITEVIYDDFTYPNTALLSIRALATDQLSGGRPKVSCLVTANSNNPSLIVQDILSKWSGVAAANISAADFSTWETFCTTNSYTCDMVFDTAVDVRQAIDTVSQLGRGIVVRIGDTYLPLIDKADELPTQGFLFTMGNIVENSFTKEYIPIVDRSNVLEVTYFDKTLDYERQSFELFQNGFDESTSEIKKSSIALYGCSDRSMAIKHGRYMLNKTRYLTNIVSFEVAIDAIVCRVGDIIRVAHDIPQWGYSGRLVDIGSTVLDVYEVGVYEAGVYETGTTYSKEIILDKDIEMIGDGTQYAISIRLSETDEIINKNIVVPIGGYIGNVVEVQTDFITAPSKYDVYSFGEVDKVTKEFRVMSITRSSEQMRKISAIEYIPEVYSDTADVIPIVNKSSLSSVQYLLCYEGTIVGLDAIPTINIVWQGSDMSWEVYFKPSSDSVYILHGTTTTTNYQITGLPLGEYDVKVGDKTASVTLEGNTQALDDIAQIVYYYRNDNTILSWDAITDARSPIDYEIRQGTVWESGAFLGRVSETEFKLASDGSYMVKAHFKTKLGVDTYSTNPATAVISGAVLTKNIIASYDEKATSWTGTKTDMIVDGDGNLRLDGTLKIDDAVDFDAITDLDFYGGVVAFGSYEIPSAHIVDVGTVEQCRIWVDYTLSGLDITGVTLAVSDKFSLTIEIAIAQADGIFGAWKNFVAGDYVGRKFKLRGLFYSYDANITVILSNAIFYVDMPDKIQSGTSVSILSTGSTVSYVNPFQVTPSTNITVINATDGDEIKLTSETASGFNVQITNGGVGVARSINWLSKGY